ncbi:HNH endonuclease [Streptomyces sp. 15-116A]|uniref:HNH endonuclease n=1 Tax=Streptomyces sp. 15-116A TaxID=2259035 RepID=UPI0021B170CB|nr:HNH endonuclease [Streptomyces sp. 15-116A]MCT7353886.1 HNH endonuclease [Streptomyces sp. 15-116A]
MSSGVQYTRERLEEAAGTCDSLDGVIAFFGTQPYGNLRRYLAQRFAHFGIDISHFRPCGRRPRPTEEELRAAVAESISLSEVLRRLDRRTTGAQRTQVRGWIAEHRISTSHFLGQAHQRGKPGTTTQRPEEVLVKHDRGHRTATKRLRRALLEVGVPEECSRCGLGPEWLGKPMTLEVDHISGDWSDDRRENLRLLCPNCHAITSTWCRGGSRRRTTPGTMAGAGGGGATATQQT